MKRSELEEIIEEEIYKALSEIDMFGEMVDYSLDEKSVPQPYNRNSPPRRKMSRAKIQRRDTVGKSMKRNKKSVAYFKKKFGKDWESYLWAAASNVALRGGESAPAKKPAAKKKPAKKPAAKKTTTRKTTPKKQTGDKE